MKWSSRCVPAREGLAAGTGRLIVRRMQPGEYRKMAGAEETMWYYRALHGHVLRTLAGRLANPHATVLDAGCGTGGLLYRLHEAQPFWSLTGLDFSPIACGLARERNSGTIVQGSIASLPFADATFDAIVSCDVACQVADPAAAFAEFSRCVRPGGLVVVTMPAYQWMYSYHDREVGNLRRYTRTEVNALLRAAGLSILRTTYWSLLPFPLAVLRRKIFPPARSTSDVKLYPAPVEAMFNGLMALERAWLRLGATMPFGSSILTVAGKP